MASKRGHAAAGCTVVTDLAGIDHVGGAEHTRQLRLLAAGRGDMRPAPASTRR
jgi:hypothetical protein